jgi:heme-degrading monooxygenase HmoA
MSDKPLLIVQMDMAEEKEEEFNKWYNEKHIPEILRVKGFVSGKRYKAAKGSPKYLAVYEFENAEVIKDAMKDEEFAKAGKDFQDNYQPHASNMSVMTYIPIEM